MKYLIEDITLNDEICNIELELIIACHCGDVELDGFTVLGVTTDSGEFLNPWELAPFEEFYYDTIQKELDNDDSLVNQVEDFLQDERDEYLISNYEDNKQAQIDHWECNNY